MEETPLDDCTESVLRHLDCLVFSCRSFPGMVGCWFQLNLLCILESFVSAFYNRNLAIIPIHI